MPGEPDLSSPQPVLFVRHQSIGLVKRIFPEDTKMKMVYYGIFVTSTVIIIIIIIIVINIIINSVFFIDKFTKYK